MTIFILEKKCRDGYAYLKWRYLLDFIVSISLDKELFIYNLTFFPEHNLTRRDSDIVAPYEKWQYYDDRVRQQEQDRNYAANKTKKVAWFVSNCGARNGRLQFAHELGKYIDVRMRQIPPYSYLTNISYFP